MITAHAWERFVQRWREMHGGLPRCPRKVLLALIAKATPEDIGEAGRVRRLIHNGFQDADYYTADGWRFVVSNGTLLTCERAIYKARPPKKLRAHRRPRP